MTDKNQDVALPTVVVSFSGKISDARLVELVRQVDPEERLIEALRRMRKNKDGTAKLIFQAGKITKAEVTDYIR